MKDRVRLKIDYLLTSQLIEIEFVRFCKNSIRINKLGLFWDRTVELQVILEELSGCSLWMFRRDRASASAIIHRAVTIMRAIFQFHFLSNIN